jgi:hypothetical protein
MISNAQNENGTFSADVELNLHVGDQRFELGHLGPGFALFGDAQSIDATEGEIETIIDEKVSRWKVRFTSPITGESRRFTFEAV